MSEKNHKKTMSVIAHLCAVIMFLAAGIIYCCSWSQGTEADTYTLTGDAGSVYSEAGRNTVADVQKEAALEAARPLHININTADAAELTKLTGIGETRADAIIAYRSEHGGFKSIEEIMQVSGIKEGTFAKIKDFIYVEEEEQNVEEDTGG